MKENDLLKMKLDELHVYVENTGDYDLIKKELKNKNQEM